MTEAYAENRNKEVVRRIFEDSINLGRLDLLNQLIADDYVGQVSGPPSGRAEFTATVEALREGFPDIQYELENLVAEGDEVAVRWRWSGTHRATFHGPGGAVLPPTGKAVANDGMAIFEVKEGKAVRSWVLTDRLGFLQAVGARP
jgi:predicted ester cyclase